MLGVGLALLAASPASAVTICVRGPVYVKDGRVTAESDIVKRGRNVECPEGVREIVDEGERRALSSSEIKEIRDRKKAQPD